MQVTVEVPEGMILFPYFVKEEDAAIAVECYASKAMQVYDEDGEPTLSAEELARIAVKAKLDRPIQKYQEQKLVQIARAAGEIKTNVVQ